MADSLKTAEQYEISQLQQGQTAFGAIVALQDQGFVSGLREFAKDSGQRSRIANQIMADPSYAASFKGADSAAGLVVAAFSDQGHKLIELGGKIHQAAYDVQHQSLVQGRRARPPRPPGPGQGPVQPAAETPSRSTPSAWARTPTAPSPWACSARLSRRPTPPWSNRALAVAAMAAIGEGGDEYSPQLTALLTDSVEGQCLRLAKLNLYQCLSVAKPHYEDVFCLGQHAVGETGQCVMKGAVAGYVIPSSMPAAAPQDATQVASKPRGKKKLVEGGEGGLIRVLHRETGRWPGGAGGGIEPHLGRTPPQSLRDSSPAREGARARRQTRQLHPPAEACNYPHPNAFPVYDRRRALCAAVSF
ncbi:MAG: hypothetical protein WDN45_02920 [Caulobacteraceae bacterium]